MQQPQSRPLLGDSVSSTTSPTARRSNPVAVLTQQQLQQLQQLQAQNTTGQSLTFALQQASNDPQDHGNGSTSNHIVYVNQLNQLNQGTINPSGTGMGLPPATPAFGVGLNMGLPLSLLNTSLTSLTSNVITTSNPLLNLGLSNINTAGITTINPGLNTLTTINSNLNPGIGSSNINGSLSNLGQDLNGINTGISRLNTLNTSGISSSGLAGVNATLTQSVDPASLTSLNSNISQNLGTLNTTNLTTTNPGVSGLATINPNLSNANLAGGAVNSAIGNQTTIDRSINALTTGLTPTSLTSSSAQFPFQTIQSIQSIAPHIVGSSITHVSNNSVVSQQTQHSETNTRRMPRISQNSGTLTTSTFATTASETIRTATGTNIDNHTMSNVAASISHLGTMHTNLSNISSSSTASTGSSLLSSPSSSSAPPSSSSSALTNTPHQHHHITESNITLDHFSSQTIGTSATIAGFPQQQQQRQYSQALPPGSSVASLTGSTNVVPSSNATAVGGGAINTVKSVQNIQNQNINSPGSPFSIPLKSPASNIAPPTPSPSPNRFLLRSPASNSIQSSRNSPSPVGTSTSSSQNFSVQMQSPMQSPMSNVGQIQSPVLSPYPPAKSPHLLSGANAGGNSTLNNRSPAPGGSPGPPLVRSNTPILQQGMQVLQIIHGTPQGYQSAPTQLVTRTHLFGNQQIQIAATKPAKQPPQILPKPPNQQATNSQQKQQRATTTITNQVTQQQTQPQIVLAGPQPNPTTAAMIPTAQGLLLNQVLPSTGPVIVQQQPGGVQLILRTPASVNQQQTHTAQLTQQQLVRVVTAQGMQLQGIAPTFFAVPNGFTPAASPVIRHAPSSPAPSNSGTAGNSIVIQNAMVQNPQQQMGQVNTAGGNTSAPSAVSCGQAATIESNLLPPPKKKAKKKKKAKRKDEQEPPKLDLASIMKISGIGDDDDIFDGDTTTTESEISVPGLQPQQRVEGMAGHSMTTGQTALGQATTCSASPVLQNQPVIQVSAAQNTANPQVSQMTQQSYNSQLVAQLQMPVQNTISGQLRLAVGEDGRVVLHHTPEPNQPEIDQATAQALIRSLTQPTSGGQSSQIISQLLAQSQSSSSSGGNPQNVLGACTKSKFVKSSSLSTAVTTGREQLQTTNIQATNPSSHQIQGSGKTNDQSKAINVSRETSSIVCAQTNTIPGTVPHSFEMPTPMPQPVKNAHSSSHVNVQSTFSNNILPAPDAVLPDAKSSVATFNVQLQNSRNTTATTAANASLPCVNQPKASQMRQTATNTNVRMQNAIGKHSLQQSGKVLQKSMQASLQNQVLRRNEHLSKGNQNIQLVNRQDSLSLEQQQQQQQQQQSQQQQQQQRLAAQNIQQAFEQNIQVSGSSSMQHTSMPVLPQQNTCNTIQHDGVTTVMQQQAGIQQNMISVLQQQQQNMGGNVQNIEQTLQPNMGDVTQGQQNTTINIQQNHSSTGMHRPANVQQNVHMPQQQKIAIGGNAFSTNNGQQYEQQNSIGGSVAVHKGTTNMVSLQQQQQNNQSQNVLISNCSTPNNIHNAETQKLESSNTCGMNSATNNILNNAPKISPEILNALSNLNPNDQLLIAHANGQMQVISQQFLQQFLSGQLTNQGNQSSVSATAAATMTTMATTMTSTATTTTNHPTHHNQTQKIVIGDPGDVNGQNLQGVQINTPTSQIIVNSSGGAPTIQNNIQNIVVQAAPSQMPHQIQIQNSSFPNQFIDNLNQQQIRNLGNVNQPQKKAKIVRKTKSAVTVAGAGNSLVVNHQQANKTITVGRSTISTTAATASSATPPTVASNASTLRKITLNEPLSRANMNKSDIIPQIIANGPIPIASSPSSSSASSSSSTGCAPSFTSSTSGPSNGQMMQRVQIQIPAEKQQILMNVQSQIQAIRARKSGSQADQALLAKLYQEQNKILACGKLISSCKTQQPINSATDTSFGMTVAPSNVTSNLQSQNFFSKNQTSAVQTQTQTPTCSNLPINAQNLNVVSGNASQGTGRSTTENYPMGNVTVLTQNTQVQVCGSANLHHTIPAGSAKQHKFYQNHGNQTASGCLVATSTNALPSTGMSTTPTNNAQIGQQRVFASPTNTCVSAPTVMLQSPAPQQLQRQQSTQCQTDPVDTMRPPPTIGVQMPSPVKRELSSPLQIQVQQTVGSPASHIPASPRTSSATGGKTIQRIQSPVNNITASKQQPQQQQQQHHQHQQQQQQSSQQPQLVSPGTNASTVIQQSPRQGVKRPATSPIYRQINRSDLLEQQLKMDQNGATNPDVNTPFTSKSDACKRLVRYHCLNEQVLSTKDLAKADEIFEETAKHLLSKFNSMMNKYTYLLLMESMREVRTSELMMIDRTFVAEEQNILNRLREQEAKVNEEFKKEEKPVVPKVEPGLTEAELEKLNKLSASGVSVKRELEDELSATMTTATATTTSTSTSTSNEEMDCKPPLAKPSLSCTNTGASDYDEWLEIQKELGVYPSATSSSSSSVGLGKSSKLSIVERMPRANGECRTNFSSASMSCAKEQQVLGTDGRWSIATDLERDLLEEDTGSLDGLALHSQAQCRAPTLRPAIASGGNGNVNVVSANDSGSVISCVSGDGNGEHDDITAQVQSAIDSILNLKKRPAATTATATATAAAAATVATSTSLASSSLTAPTSSTTTVAGSSQSGVDSKDTVLDQAVRSILSS